MIVRHQRESASNRGFRHLARYIHGRDTKSRVTWFHAANLPGVSGKVDLELACGLVDAVQAQNTRAGTKRTYHLVVSLDPNDRPQIRKTFVGAGGAAHGPFRELVGSDGSRGIAEHRALLGDLHRLALHPVL